MSDDAVVDIYSYEYAYVQATDIVAARIAAGRYSGKLPAERDLAAEFGVSVSTLRRALAILRERGLIVTVHGRGTFVPRESAGK